jgi:hypothetical protein
MVKPPTSLRLIIRNSLPTRRTLILEPWTTEVGIEPGESVIVQAEGDLSKPLEVELYEDRIVVYSFDSEGALLTVRQAE